MLEHSEAERELTAAFILARKGRELTGMLIDAVLEVLAKYQLPYGAAVALQDAVTAEVFGPTPTAAEDATRKPAEKAIANLTRRGLVTG